jgi:hypothetical protein
MSFQRPEQNPSPSVRARLVPRTPVRKTSPDEEELPEDGPFDYQDVTRYVTIEKAAAMTGLTAKAIRRKKEEGVWLEHREWVKGPDERIYIDLVGYAKWVKKWQ